MSTTDTEDHKFDKQAVFVHSIDENRMLKSGRAYCIGGDRNSVSFKSDDNEFPGMMIGVDDSLEPGKVFRRISPPYPADGDLEVIHGGEHGEDTTTVIFNEQKYGRIFDNKHIRGDVKDDFLEFYRRDKVRYEPVSTENRIAP